jgi:hypothetical protein
VRHITQKGDLEGDVVDGTRSVGELPEANRAPRPYRAVRPKGTTPASSL